MCAAEDRQRSDSSPPSAFVERWVRALAAARRRPGRALDVAMGRGRHARLLAQCGFEVYGVDRDLASIGDAITLVDRAGGVVRAWCADLTAAPLPAGRFDLVVVTRYLQRDLFPSLAGALAPGGILLYETFTEAQRRHGWGPTSPDHLLKAGELAELARMLEPIDYEEVDAPEAVARLAARNATSRA